MQSRPTASRHCAALDGIRGLAAVSVLLFHSGHWLNSPQFAVNGGLSVDTFFTLSGFVLALAYAQRRETWSMGKFMIMRLIRLMPMIFVSIAIAAPYALLKAFVTGQDSQWDSVLIAVLLGALNIPYFNPPAAIGGPQIFPLNGPQFSLFFELIANYFWWLLRFVDQTRLSLAVYVVSSAVIFYWGIGGDTADNFILGFFHVGSSFFAGVLAYRFREHSKRPFVRSVVFPAVLAIMLIIFFLPFELSSLGRIGWKLILAPLLVLSGAAIQLQGVALRASTYLGEISYPVYALHYPIFCWINGIYQKVHGDKNVALETVALLIVTLCVSHLCLRYFDEPVRAYLTRRALDPLPGSFRPRLSLLKKK